ncbi:MAG: hypothetical protein ABJG68_11310 [Crocinitomicaceae bacterium]
MIEFIINIPVFFLEIFLSKEQRIKRKLKKTKAKKLSEIKNGEYVKIHGIVKPHEKLMTSPLGKKRCIGYQVEVGREMSDYHEGQYINEEIIQNFYLVEGNQKILINPRRAKIALKKEVIGNSGLLKDVDSNMADFLKRHQTKAKSFGFNKSLEFKEGTLQEGQKLTIVGKVSLVKLKNNTRQLVIRNYEKYPLYLKSE